MKWFKKSNRLAYWEGEHDLIHLACVTQAWKTLREPTHLNDKALDYFLSELERVKSVIRRIKKL